MLGVAIALFWLVGITNAFNLLDNMDGLAATLAAIACVYFAIDAATVHENELVLVLSLSLAFACAGFLPFNLRPTDGARVFMGDAGSQLLGFLLAALALASSWTTAGTTVATMLLPLLVLAIPILDTTLVTVVRLVERRPVTQGGRDHTSHRLVYYGLSETRAVALLALIAVALGATSVAYNVLDRPAITALGVLAHLRAPRPVRQLPLGALGGRASRPRRRHEAAPRGHGRSPGGCSSWSSTPSLVCGRRSSLPTSSSLGGRGPSSSAAPSSRRSRSSSARRYVVYVVTGVYRRAWRYATARDLALIAAASPSPRSSRSGSSSRRATSATSRPASSSSTSSRSALAVGLALARPRLVPDGRRRDDTRRRVLVVGAGRRAAGSRATSAAPTTRRRRLPRRQPAAPTEARPGRSRAGDEADEAEAACSR